MTSIETRGGWLYLAVLLDLYSRKVVDWSKGDRNDLKMCRWLYRWPLNVASLRQA